MKLFLRSFNTFISPWVLPNESIPMHILWDKDFKFNQIRISFSKQLEVENCLNITKDICDFKKIENFLIIKKDQIKKLSSPNAFPRFFGIIFRYNKLKFDLKQFLKISVNFEENGSIIDEINLTAKIFRPMLNNKSKITPIELGDDTDKFEVPIDLEYCGFGLVSIKQEVRINKFSFSPEDESPLDRVERKLLKNVDKVEEYKEAGLTKRSIKKFFDDMREYESDTPEEREEFIEFLRSKEIELLFFKDFIQELILELKSMAKSQNVVLSSPFLEIPPECLYERITEMILYVHYTDLAGNIYPPVEIEIPVVDIRKKPEIKKINFSIKIDQIIDNKIEDVEKEGV